MSDLPKPFVGQIWVEMDPRDERYVRVEHVGTMTAIVRRTNPDGSAWPKSRSLHANLARFNSKRGGYALHQDVTP